MAIAYTNAQVQGTAAVGTYATLYNAPASVTSAIVSSITICNTAASAATYRIGLMGSAGTPGASEWLAYDSTVQANDTVCLTIGAVVTSGEFLRVSSSANTVAFAAFLAENS